MNYCVKRELSLLIFEDAATETPPEKLSSTAALERQSNQQQRLIKASRTVISFIAIESSQVVCPSHQIRQQFSLLLTSFSIASEKSWWQEEVGT